MVGWIRNLLAKIEKWDDGKCYKCMYLYKDCYGNMCQAPGWCIKEHQDG